MEDKKSLEEQIAQNRRFKSALKFHPGNKSAKLLDEAHRKLQKQLYDRDNPDAATVRLELWAELEAEHIKKADTSPEMFLRTDRASAHFEDLYDRVKDNTLNVTSRPYRLFKRVALREIKELKAEAEELKKYFRTAKVPKVNNQKPPPGLK